MDISTIICFSGFSESPKKKMLIIMHSVMEEEMDTKGPPSKSYLGGPAKGAYWIQIQSSPPNVLQRDL